MKYRVQIKIKICEDANLVWNPAVDVKTGLRLNPNSGVLFRCRDNRKRTTVSQDLRTVPSPESCSRVRAGSQTKWASLSLCWAAFSPHAPRTWRRPLKRFQMFIKKKNKCNKGERRWRLHLPADVGQVSVAQNWHKNKIHNLSFYTSQFNDSVLPRMSAICLILYSSCTAQIFKFWNLAHAPCQSLIALSTRLKTALDSTAVLASF